MTTWDEFDARSGQTLAEARRQLMEDRWEGVSCPCCGQMAKVYKRKIHASMARTLIRMYQEADVGWLYLPSVPQKSRDSTGMAWWGLIEEELARREDGGRAGWWRVTSDGEDFVRGRSKVPKYAHVYDGECLRFDHDQMVSISDALGEPFDYDELMRGV